MALLLAADIGGTKSALAIFDLLQRPNDSPVRQKRYRNREFHDFNAILTHFLTASRPPEYGCFGVAAVIRQGTAKLTNLDWVLNEQELENRFGFHSITLINDLTAVCSSLPLLLENDLLTIQQGQPEEHGVRAVIAPGTGLGEGFLVEQGSCFFPQGSEGGHCDFAPLNQEQVELLAYLRKNSAAVSYELLCSGKGIPNIFDFFASTELTRDETRFKQIAEAEDRTVDIVAGALAESPCPLCEKTMSVFLEILGSEAGNLALKNYATGGLFIGGGILPRIAGRISFTPFLQAFRQKEKMQGLMASIPVHLILRQDAALLGAAKYGHQLFSVE
ncbi:MAG: glucokinase [Desulfocapsa sp.]|nr:glucokinase [Desulfocapsa sp.]